MTTLEQDIDIRRGSERMRTAIDWLDSRHSFSFGGHQDPANTHFGLLLVSNDDIVRPDTGFQTHPHRDMEIVTWVLSGELEHQDSEGNAGVIYPGLAQRMSAGTGIWHSEMNATKGGDVHFVQMWVVPDEARLRPGYQQVDIVSELDRGGLVPLASGVGGQDAAIAIRQRYATLWAGRLKPGETVAVPDAPFAHLFVARGEASLESTALAAGDAARITLGGGSRVVAGAGGAEVLLWEMHASIRGV